VKGKEYSVRGKKFGQEVDELSKVTPGRSAGFGDEGFAFLKELVSPKLISRIWKVKIALDSE